MKQSIEQIVNSVKSRWKSAKGLARSTLITSMIATQLAVSAVAAPVSKRFTYHVDTLTSTNRNVSRYQEPRLVEEKGDPSITYIGKYSAVSASGKDDEHPIEVELGVKEDCISISYRIRNLQDKRLATAGQIFAEDAEEHRVFLALPVGVIPKFDEMTQSIYVTSKKDGKEDIVQAVPKNRTDGYIACSLFNAVMDPENNLEGFSQLIDPELSKDNNEMETTYDIFLDEFAGKGLKKVLDEMERFVRWQRKGEYDSVRTMFPGKVVYEIPLYAFQNAAVINFSRNGRSITIPLENLLDEASRANVAIRDLDWKRNAPHQETKSLEAFDFGLTLPAGKEKPSQNFDLNGTWSYICCPDEDLDNETKNSGLRVTLTPKRMEVRVNNETETSNIASTKTRGHWSEIIFEDEMKERILHLGPDVIFSNSTVLGKTTNLENQGRVPDLREFNGKYRLEEPISLSHPDMDPVLSTAEIEDRMIRFPSPGLEYSIEIKSPLRKIGEGVFMVDGIETTETGQRKMTNKSTVILSKQGKTVIFVNDTLDGTVLLPVK